MACVLTLIYLSIGCLFTLYVRCFACVHVLHTISMPGAQRGQEGALDPLELERTIDSYITDAGN